MVKNIKFVLTASRRKLSSFLPSCCLLLHPRHTQNSSFCFNSRNFPFIVGTKERRTGMKEFGDKRTLNIWLAISVSMLVDYYCSIPSICHYCVVPDIRQYGNLRSSGNRSVPLYIFLPFVPPPMFILLSPFPCRCIMDVSVEMLPMSSHKYEYLVRLDSYFLYVLEIQLTILFGWRMWYGDKVSGYLFSDLLVNTRTF